MPVGSLSVGFMRRFLMPVVGGWRGGGLGGARALGLGGLVLAGSGACLWWGSGVLDGGANSG
jgi:hypothetical protein